MVSTGKSRARVTVSVYTSTVSSSAAATSMLMTLTPTAKLISPLSPMVLSRSEEMVTVASASSAVAVTMVCVVAFSTAAVYAKVAAAKVGDKVIPIAPSDDNTAEASPCGVTGTGAGTQRLAPSKVCARLRITARTAT